MIYANPIVGRTGLCNMLLPWARAEVFARKCGARILAPQWTNYFRTANFLHGERSRYYQNEFTNEGYVKGVRRFCKICFGTHVPEKDFDSRMDDVIVDFRGMDGFMASFFMEHDFIKERLLAITNPYLLKRVDQLSRERFIGVHIRRGDFLRVGLDIEDEWYVTAIRKAQEMAGDMPIRVFSDASPAGLMNIVRSFGDRVTIMPPGAALQDLLTLAASTVMVGTSRSSFSYWAIYLGQMPSVLHPVYLQKPDRLYVNNEKPNIL